MDTLTDLVTLSLDSCKTLRRNLCTGTDEVVVELRSFDGSRTVPIGTELKMLRDVDGGVVCRVLR